MTRTLVLLASIAFLLLPTGDAQAQIPSCDALAFTPCGGDLAGTWEYDEIECFQAEGLAALIPGCVGGSAAIEAEVGGAITFHADGSYVNVQVTDGVITVTVPRTCLPDGAACDALGLAPGMTMTEDATHCHMHVPKADTEVEVGTYAVEGDAATLTESDGDVDNGHFCVAGDRLTVRIRDDEAGIEAVIGHNRVR